MRKSKKTRILREFIQLDLLSDFKAANLARLDNFGKAKEVNEKNVDSAKKQKL